jgi:hypothetical protein
VGTNMGRSPYLRDGVGASARSRHPAPAFGVSSRSAQNYSQLIEGEVTSAQNDPHFPPL